ncbi:MAG: hypothetical protein ACO1OB_29525 [Archangium sp.]
MATKKPTPSPILKKLSYKGGSWFAPNVPAELKKLLSGIEQTTRAPKVPEASILFARDSKELERVFKKIEGKLRGDPMLWICYPKGGVDTDLNRDILWKSLWPKGLRPVAQVSLDDTWSAMRFRPQGLVKSKPGEGPTGPGYSPVDIIPR